MVTKRWKPTCILTMAASLSEKDRLSCHDGMAEARPSVTMAVELVGGTHWTGLVEDYLQ